MSWLAIGVVAAVTVLAVIALCVARARSQTTITEMTIKMPPLQTRQIRVWWVDKGRAKPRFVSEFDDDDVAE